MTVLDLEVPVVSADPAVQAHYETCRANGCSHDLGLMLALRQFPGIAGTDAVFNEGRKLDGSQFQGLPPAMGKMYLELARKAGVNPAGKYYCGSIARYPGDPRAWVDSRGDVKRICEAEGWTVAGAVKVESPRYADGYVPPEKYAVAADIVAAEVADRLAADPEPVTAAKVEAVTAEVARTRAGVHGT